MGAADYCMYTAKKSERNAWVGLNNVDHNKKDILKCVNNNIKQLIDFKQLKVKSSVMDK